MNEQKQKEFDRYLNEQLNILQGHHSRIMLRVWNYYVKLENSENKQK